MKLLRSVLWRLGTFYEGMGEDFMEVGQFLLHLMCGAVTFVVCMLVSVCHISLGPNKRSGCQLDITSTWV